MKRAHRPSPYELLAEAIMYPNGRPPMKREEKESKFDLMAELQRGVKFNKHTMDDDLMDQPVLFQRVASLLATAESDEADQEKELKLAEAELFLQYKESGEFSEKQINAKVETSSRVQKLKRSLMVVERRVRELKALEKSYSQRSHSIRGEIDLYEAQYWEKESGGSRKREETDRRAERAKKHYNEED